VHSFDPLGIGLVIVFPNFFNLHTLCIPAQRKPPLLAAANALVTSRYVRRSLRLGRRRPEMTATTILFRTYVAAARRSSISLSDGFIDCAVLQSAMSFFQSAEYQDPIALHRCLQHTKTNVRWAAKTRHEGSGETRLRNTELLGITIEFLHWSVPSLHGT